MMICSMTGFGSAHLECEFGTFEIAIKTTNNRFLDFAFRLPVELANFEPEIRKMIGKAVHRGRIEVGIRWMRGNDVCPNVDINIPLFEKLYQDLTDLQKRLGAQGCISVADLLHIPSIYVESPACINKKRLWGELKKGITKALHTLQRSRRAEGKRLAQALLNLLNVLENSRAEVAKLKDVVVEKYRQRLLKKIEEFNQSNRTGLDQQRLDAEVLLYADKSDITEELARLESHIAAFRNYLESESKETVGRPLDFLCQEVLREVNTIGSKSHDTGIANLVLSMKNDVEKLREQIHNIE